MKRLLAALCIALLLLPQAALGAEIPKEPLWTARTRINCTVYTELALLADGEKFEGINKIGAINKGVRVQVYFVEPTWAYVSVPDSGLSGYIRRSCLEEVEPLNPLTTPPYGVERYLYYTTLTQPVSVMNAKSHDAKALITLQAGARLAFIGVEEGWAKLIYHRQYAYVDTRLLGELSPTAANIESADASAPIAAFVSFYKITTDESNLGRMENIRVACRKLSAMLFGTGDNLNFNRDIGPYNAREGYQQAIVLVDGGSKLGYGGGTCQVSSTLYNTVLQLPGLTILQRRAHGPSAASYLPHGVDAAVGNSELNFRFRNDYPFPVRIDASSQDGALYIAIYRAE